jgi:hypothetical protein
MSSADLERRVRRIEKTRQPKTSPEGVDQIEAAARRMEVEELRHLVQWNQSERAGKPLGSAEQRMHTLLPRKVEFPWRRSPAHA